MECTCWYDTPSSIRAKKILQTILLDYHLPQDEDFPLVMYSLLSGEPSVVEYAYRLVCERLSREDSADSLNLAHKMSALYSLDMLRTVTRLGGCAWKDVIMLCVVNKDMDCLEYALRVSRDTTTACAIATLLKQQDTLSFIQQTLFL